jgi:hypothetical protein
MTRFLLSSLALAALACAPAAAQPPREHLRDRPAPHPAETLDDATAVLADLSRIPARGIPPALVAEPRGWRSSLRS